MGTSVIDTLEHTYRTLVRGLEKAKAEARETSRKIHELEALRDQLKQTLDDIKEAQSEERKIKPEKSWSGRSRKEFDGGMDCVKQNTDSIKRRTSSTLGAVKREIATLYLTINKIGVIANSFEDQIARNRRDLARAHKEAAEGGKA